MLLSCFPDIVTYWAPTGVNADAEVSFALPVSLNARWQTQNKLILDSEGKEIVSQAVVYIYNTPYLELEGYLFKGLSTETDPYDVPESYEIKRVDLTHDLDNLESLLKIWL